MFARRMGRFCRRFVLVEPHADWKGSWIQEPDCDWLLPDPAPRIVFDRRSGEVASRLRRGQWRNSDTVTPGNDPPIQTTEH